MEEIRKYHTTAAALIQSWTRQPFARQAASLALDLPAELEKAFYFFSQGKQFVYVYDYLTGGLAFLSRNIAQVLGYGPEEVSPEFFYCKMHPADHDQVLRISCAGTDLVLQHKDIGALTLFLTVDCRLRHADGRYIKMQRQTSILQRDERGNIRFSLGIFTDISHLKRGPEVTFDLSMPEYKVKLLDILASYEQALCPRPFSAREKQVLGLMALGKNTRQIAQELSLSSYTIDTHRKNMKKKLQARNTAELITSAFARKII